MDKSTQDLLWACLPKEVREEIKRLFSNADATDNFTAIGVFLKIFGQHNLTSDTEPDEMVHINRRTLIDRYASYSKESDNIKNNEPYLQFCEGRLNALANLFGDKCLPDKEPKFRKGEVVRSKSTNEILKIFANCSEIEKTSCLCVCQDGSVRDFPINDLEPEQTSVQVEPKFKVGDKVSLKYQYCMLKDPCLFTIKNVGEVDIDGVFTYSVKESDKVYRETMFEPYTEPETKDIEEKELNLVELLKDCEGEKFFSLMFGDVTFVKVVEEPNLGFGEKPIATSEGRYLPNAMYGLDGVPTLFPSKELYEKYPLDAYSAWMEWKEARKQKYILQAEIRLISIDGKTIEDYENVEMEVSDIDLTQAAEGVREYLLKFQ